MENKGDGVGVPDIATPTCSGVKINGHKGRRASKGSRKGYAMPSGQLKDMRHVYRYGEDSDKTPGQRAYRKLFESNPKAFLAAMQKAESDHRANCRKRAADLEAAKDFVAAGGGGKKVVVEVDEGSRRVLDLVEQLLLEFKSGRVV